MSEYKGNLYRANSSDCEPVHIEVAGDGLVLRRVGNGSERLGDHVQTIPVDRLELTNGGFDGKRIFIKDTADGATIMTESHGLLAELEKVHALPAVLDNVRAVRASMADVPRREQRHWMIFLGVCAAIGIGIYLSVDAMVDMAVAHIPPKLETTLGDLVLKDYQSKHELSEKGPQVERVQHIVDRLVRNVSEVVPAAQTYPYHVYVEQSDDINAFALPGGNIVVLTGLLDRAKNDSEIAGVLGHEVGHVIGRHSLRSALHRAGLFACLSVIFQGQGSNEAMWLSGLIDLDSLRFSRDEEAEADKTGVHLSALADYDPHGLIAFFQRVQEIQKSGRGAMLNSKMFELLSNHPCTPDRIRAVQDEIAAMEKERAGAKKR